MNEVIEESGMSFGPYPEGHCFYIEKSALYAGLGEGLQIGEFALLRESRKGQALWLVEAKSSSPRPGTLPGFDTFIADIAQKMTNTLQILLAAILKRHTNTDELSKAFQAIHLQAISIKFILVINGHREDWLPPIQHALNQKLAVFAKSLALGAQTVAVLNHSLAQRHGLIAAPTTA